MRINKPTPDPETTVRVSIIPANGGRSINKTYYDTTPEEILGAIESNAEDADSVTKHIGHPLTTPS